MHIDLHWLTSRLICCGKWRSCHCICCSSTSILNLHGWRSLATYKQGFWSITRMRALATEIGSNLQAGSVLPLPCRFSEKSVVLARLLFIESLTKDSCRHSADNRVGFDILNHYGPCRDD
jgi:hypothetical protein